MIIEYYGHSMFCLTLADGVKIIMDPYGAVGTYPKRTLSADICTVSHHHFDHDAVETSEGSPVIIETEGVHTPKDGIRITGIPTFHDETNGSKRGSNLIFVIEADGLKIVHLGDLGHLLSNTQVAAIGKPDILMLPVGGYYTIDASTALQVMKQLQPAVTIPMHYQTSASMDMPITPVADFLQLLPISPEPMKLCRITPEDIAERPAVLWMTTPEGL